MTGEAVRLPLVSRPTRALLLTLAVGCAFDSSGQGSGSDETTSSAGETSSSATTATTDATTATTAMTSGDTDTTTSMTSTMSTTMSTTDPDSSGTDPSTTEDPTTETTEDTATTGASACDVDNGGCDPNATCAEIDGSIKCTCDVGFVGPGTLCAATPVMPTLRAEMPCTGGECAGGSTCFTDNDIDESVVMNGDPGVTYGVLLAVRGVLEHQEYDGQCDGQWCVGGNAPLNPWNEVTITISDPPAEYHPNNGAAGVFEVFAIDEERTVAITAGATITITIDGNGSCSIDNSQAIVIPGVPPDPQPFDGQFLQLDLLDATIAG